MQFLKTLFWVVVAVVAAIFSYRNWIPVSISMWGGMIADVKLPVLLLASFLIGFLPSFLIYRVSQWRMKRRLDLARRELEEARGIGVVEVPVGTSLPIPPVQSSDA